MPATGLGRESALYLLGGKTPEESPFGHEPAVAWGFAARARSCVFNPFSLGECGDVIHSCPSALLWKAVEKLC